MKVVLFCGGFGMRLREYSETLPKPMVPIGYRPILWHIMKYYAHYGHKDFILCLGWKADAIKSYFLNYNECLSNDFTLSAGGKDVDLINRDIHDWNITFVDTGMNASIGERLYAVREYLSEEEMFLANYADGLTDMPLPSMIDFHQKRQAVASFLSVRPNQTFHEAKLSPDGQVENLKAIHHSDVWMNGGYFVFNREFLNYLHAGEEVVEQPFDRLIALNRLYAYRYEGFWRCMDTYKEKQEMDDCFNQGNTPWTVWDKTTGPLQSPVIGDPASTTSVEI